MPVPRYRATAAQASEAPTPWYVPHAGLVLVDSGPLIALFNGADRWYAEVRGWLQGNPRATLLTTWPVATEICAMLARRIHNDAALDFLRWAQRGGIALDSAAEGSLTEVLRLTERFKDLPFDLADASVAEAAARLKLRHVLSIDADFDVHRDRAGRPLVNLLRRGQRPRHVNCRRSARPSVHRLGGAVRNTRNSSCAETHCWP